MTPPRSPRPGSLRRAGAIGVLATVVAGCGTGVATLSLPVPAPSTTSASTTTPPTSDQTGVREAAVAGHATTTAPAIGPGQAAVSGTVLGPAGPVAGATVQAERIVGAAIASTQATTAADGSFSIAGVLGGIYRVRAWQAPSLALTTAQTFFLAASATQTLSLQLQSFSGVMVTSSMAPDPVEVGADANLVVAVTAQTVGSDGVVRPEPQVGQGVTVDGSGEWVAVTADPTTTDARGQAEVELTCDQAGAQELVVTVTGAAPTTVVTSPCVEPPPPTTATTTAPTTTAAGAPGLPAG